jgi:serine/threonine-protein kinase
MVLFKSKGSRFLQDRFLTIGKLALLAGVLAVVFLFSVILGMRFSVRGKVFETPSIVGMSIVDAEGLFEKRELNLAVVGRRYDPDVPKDAIISQLPAVGVGIKTNRDVQVVVSMGKRPNPVPDLRGRSARAARLLAKQNGYELGKVSEMLAGSEENERIIAQYPQPHSEENVSDRIDVLVQKKSVATYIMPDIIGDNLNRVMVFFEDNGFEIARVQYKPHQGIGKGTVVRQFPEPGYLLKEDESIHLEVAR